MIRFEHKGSFQKTERFLKKVSSKDIYKQLDAIARRGVEALRAATPRETGLTAESWYYEILHTRTSSSITFFNRHVVSGRPIAILLQYGHATRTGGYVKGRDYINPALKPIFNQIADQVWKVVTSA